MKKIFTTLLAAGLLFAGCLADDPTGNPVTYGDGYMPVQLATDKAIYRPNEPVAITLNKMIDGAVTVRYRHLNQVIKEEPLTTTNWSWNPPADDGRAYLIDLYATAGGKETVYGSIAVDVSSDYTRFPRNGFLSTYSKMPKKDIERIIKNLNRHHITYVQYQDWHYKHHAPLAGTPANPMMTWTDIISRVNSYETITNYIDETHRYGMKSVFYNLAYGALSDAADDGVQEEWYLFNDNQRISKVLHQLDSPFKSNIYVVNPWNQAWIDYLAGRNNDVYAVFDFDGFQIDQLGNAFAYDYWGHGVEIQRSFKQFIEKMKAAQPSKSLIMNAVMQGGQDLIAQSPVDFLYTEIWVDKSYKDAARIITENDRLSGNTKKTILAAYLNYDISDSRGYFNTPGVLMANAVFHAWGGAHLELGEHMLCNEYFPNNNRTMNGDLKKAMIAYYDFITAYENILREGHNWKGVDATSPDGKMNLDRWEPKLGKVVTVGKLFDNRAVVHLLNFTDAVHLDWVDAEGLQPEPKTIENATITLTVEDLSKPVRSVWMASPDVDFGVARTLEFVQSGHTVTVTLPSLKYWDMVVLEFN
jgi:dextranase